MPEDAQTRTSGAGESLRNRRPTPTVHDVEPQPEPAPAPIPEPAPEEREEKQCRICLDGVDSVPELGRLIRPCLCRGTISYVHVKCLQRWRTSSPTKTAFYACPQCHYKYHFARTRALGIASNPLFVATLSTILFTLLVYLASFLATYFLPPSSYSASSALYDDEDLETPSPMRFSFFYGYWVSPFDVAKDLIRIIYRILQDEDLILSSSSSSNSFSSSSSHLRSTSPLRPVRPLAPPGPFASFFRRIVLGLPVIGVASLVQMLWSLSMLTPFHWVTRWRAMGGTGGGGNRRSRSRDIATLLIIVAIVGGAIRALWQVYRLVERFSKYILLRAEDSILEVN